MVCRRGENRRVERTEVVVRKLKGRGWGEGGWQPEGEGGARNSCRLAKHR
jgi:hypothetical protein